MVEEAKPEIVEIMAPWEGPVGDEWDSASWDAFWGPVERRFNEQVLALRAEGKTVKIIPYSPTPEDGS